MRLVFRSPRNTDGSKSEETPKPRPVGAESRGCFSPFPSTISRPVMPIQPNSYCAFCGFILAPDRCVEEGATAPEPPPRRRRKWHEEVRGLTIFDDSGSPSLTGVGLVYPSKRLSAPHGRDLTYLDHHLSGDWGLRNTRWGSWAFGVHDACWQILRFRLPGWHETDILTSAYRQLLCVPYIKSSWLGFDHERFRWSDPFAISLTDISEAAQPLPSTSVGDLQVGSCRAFDPLSTELIHEILSHLSCKEVPGLRLVNRSLAATAAVKNLPQSYWRSRFLLGQEADFIFPDLSETRDWRALFFGQMKLLQSDGSESLLTRKRIRNMLEPFARVLEDAAAPWPGLFGMAACRVGDEESQFQIRASDDAVDEPVVLEQFNLLTADITSNNAHELISHGCRVVDHVTCRVPNPHQCDQGRIAVSTFHIGVMTFIAGIGIFPSARGDDDACIIGFHNSKAAKWLDMPTASSIEGIHAAFAEEGLAGVMFTFTDGTESHWIGVSEGSGIAQGLLDVAGKPQARYLMAGVDVSYRPFGQFHYT